MRVGTSSHVPDLYDGRTFSDLDEGVAHARDLGFENIAGEGRTIAEQLSSELVYAGFSLGALPAQMLAQTRSGAKGAVLFHATFPVSEFGDAWPEGVPMQIHTMEDDDWGDVDVAREVAATVDDAELFLYPGDAHLFTDNSLPAYDEGSARLVKQRVVTFLDSLG